MKEINNNKNNDKDFWQGFCSGLTIIIINGIGDKLFFLNMIYGSINSFCHSFWVVLAISEIMNLINISLGKLLKKYVSIEILDYIAIGIFVFLGVCLIIKGLRMEEKKLIQNYEEEKNLIVNKEKKENDKEEINNNDNENNYKPIVVIENAENKKEEPVGVFDSWWKYLITYFFASIGDKSQIASILLTTKYEYIPVFSGTTVGILVLVLLALIFGKSIAKMLTNRQISTICGILFLLYALVFFIDKKLKKKNK